MGSRSFERSVIVLLLAGLFVCGLSATGESQGMQQSPYSGANIVRGGALGGVLDLTPSNLLGLPGSFGAPKGPESLCFSDGMLRDILPLIPNLQFGYLYDFGSNRVNQGRFTADYLLPFRLGADSMVFGEAHTEFDSFWNTLKSTFTSGTTSTTENGFNNRVDLSFGGGFRTFLRSGALVGVNGFYDTSRLGGTWYSSGGLGFETAALVAGSDAIDFNFNWYGKIFNSNVIVNAFRYGPSNFDFQAGYSHELWNGGPDLRLSATGYKFDIGESVYGWNAGAELKTRDNMFVLKYAVGHDKVDQTYQTVGGFVNVGFQLENLFRGESPFTKPEPIFNSPRHTRYMLTQKVHRNWHQPTTAVVVRSTSTSTSSSAIPFTATATASCIPAPGANFFAISPNVPLATVGTDSTLTIIFTGATTADGGAVFLFTDSFDSMPPYPVAPNATSVTIPYSGNERFFGGGSIVGTTFFLIVFVNDSSTTPWCPGLVTLTWQ